MEIKPYPQNAKKHSDKQLKQIADSLRRFGWQQPIKVGDKGIILVGHGRWLAYQKYPEGIKEPWIINDAGVVISGEAEQRKLTEEEEKAYRLADNKLNESEWDMGLAIDELKGLSDEMFDLTGFDKSEFEGMENAEQISELARERDLDLGQYDVLTVEAPEAPRLKARWSFYTRNKEEFDKLKDFFEVRGGVANIDKLLNLLND